QIWQRRVSQSRPARRGGATRARRMPVGTRPVAVYALLMFGPVSTAAFAQEQGDARGASRTVTACVALESDYVRSSTPGGNGTGVTALVLSDVSSGKPVFNVSGPREADLAGHVGR